MNFWKKHNDDEIKKEEKKEKEKKKNKNNLLILLIKIAIILALVFVIFFVIFGVHRTNGSSMAPYITDGNLLIYYRLDKDYVVGDVVIVKQDKEYNVYRISGTNGDQISIEEGTLLINGFREEMQGFYDTDLPEDNPVDYPCVIGEDEYFVTNDFRLDLNDSRTFGKIKKKDIVGRVIAKLQIRGI